MHARPRGSSPVRRFLAAAAATVASFLLLAPSPVAAAGDADTGDGSSPTTVAPPAGLLSSWPAADAMLWVPPKEGRLTFTVPVKASTLEVTVARVDGPRLVNATIDRLTSGETVTEILLRLPKVVPGSYQLDWAVQTSAGSPLEGSIRFGLEAPIAAVGGQNHRHGESHLYEDTPGQFALRVVYVLAAAFVFAGIRRARSREKSGLIEKSLVRTGAALLLFAAAISAIVDAVNWVDEYHDKAFSAFLASPGLAFLLPVGGFAVYLLVGARTSNAVAAGTAAVLAGYAGLSHAIRTALGAELFVAFTVLLLALAALWSEILRSSLPSPDADRGTALPVAVAALVASSLLMLFLHAGTFDLEMAFARDLRSRLVLSAALAVASAFTILFGRSRRRLAALIPLPVLLVSSALLAWMPPPAAGL
jgi:methionine-rich copper-binding protein CopC